MFTRRRCVALAFVALLLPAPLFPQSTEAPAVLGNLDPGTNVRMTVDSRRIDGAFVKWTDGLFTVQSSTGTENFTALQIDTLWVQGRSTSTASLIGLAIGTIPVLMLCQPIDECGLVPYGLVLIGSGGLLGAFVGSSIRTWRRLWPR